MRQEDNMKKTHLSDGIYDQSWRPSSPLSRIRKKHRTMCGTVCDCTKATTDPARVTCLPCQKKARVS